MVDKLETYDFCSLLCDKNKSGCPFKKDEYKEYLNRLDSPPCMRKKAPCIRCGKEIRIIRDGWLLPGSGMEELFKKIMPAEIFQAWKESVRRLSMKEFPAPCYCDSCREIVMKEIKDNIPNYNKVEEFFESLKDQLLNNKEALNYFKEEV